jgi:hypothetical protein
MKLFEYFLPFLSKVCQQLAHREIRRLTRARAGTCPLHFCLPKLEFLLVRLHHGSPLTDTIIVRRTVPSTRPIFSYSDM